MHIDLGAHSGAHSSQGFWNSVVEKCSARLALRPTSLNQWVKNLLHLSYQLPGEEPNILTNHIQDFTLELSPGFCLAACECSVDLEAQV